jgi:hypothetical protein
MSPEQTPRHIVVILGGALTAFIAALGYLVVSSMAPRHAPEFTPTSPRHAIAADSGLVTLDGRDERRWVFFDADRGVPLVPPDTGGWDLAVRRHTIIVKRDVASAGRQPFDSLRVPPAASAFVATTFARETTNAVLSRWYRYGSMTHLLDPDGRIFVVRTGESRLIKVQLVSYYCPHLDGGCLTFRFAPLVTP